jgi:hypothetical protein
MTKKLDFQLDEYFPFVLREFKAEDNIIFYSLENLFFDLQIFAKRKKLKLHLLKRLKSSIFSYIKEKGYIINKKEIIRLFIIYSSDYNLSKDENGVKIHDQTSNVIELEDFEDIVQSYSENMDPINIDNTWKFEDFIIKIKKINVHYSISCLILSKFYIESRQRTENYIELSILLNIQEEQLKLLYNFMRLVLTIKLIELYCLCANLIYSKEKKIDLKKIGKKDNSIFFEELFDHEWYKNKFSEGFLAGMYWKDQNQFSVSVISEFLTLIKKMVEKSNKYSKDRYILNLLRKFKSYFNKIFNLMYKYPRNKFAHIVPSIQKFSPFISKPNLRNLSKIFSEYVEIIFCSNQFLDILEKIIGILIRDREEFTQNYILNLSNIS